MKTTKIYLLAFAFIFSIGFTSCEATKNMNNTQKGAGIGAASGAVIGGIIGNNVGKGGNTALGAIIGGVVGGTAGGLIGNSMDKQAREIDEALPGAEVERVGEGIKLTLGENSVNFDLNKSSLTSTAKANLDKLVPVFNDYPDTNIDIFGYTDSSGSDDYNLKLSEQRAASVKTYLVSKGLSAGRINTIGRGEADPIASNDTKEGMSKNRRVEFAITANEKMVEDAKKQAQ
ncbi:OmpA family protein [Flavobacterium beibuense]|uniref:Putative lipoprotein YiaD n=1 Tax=Flavobacterium beibuense TaxID=657326 RepID=A0A444WIL6_9FLAO|nr:OmpA family protein [Flavobacterium beibuense]RYJ45635.1 putative lipoprotein YiaD [Flavobacterium beibuense]